MARRKAEAERLTNDREASRRNSEGAVETNERISREKESEHNQAKKVKAEAIAARARDLAEEERRNNELKETDRKTPTPPVKPTVSVEEMHYSENNTHQALDRAMVKEKPESTVLKRALTAHQLRLSQRGREERDAANKARMPRSRNVPSETSLGRRT